MAKKSEKAAAKSSGSKSARSKKLVKSALLAMASPVSTTASVGVVFTSGLGQATISLFRQGLLINMQTISVSGSVQFTDVEPGDAISINGVCTKSATVTITGVSTSPATPTVFSAGTFNIGYDVLQN